MMGAGGALHEKNSYEQEVLKQIAHLDEASRAEEASEEDEEGSDEQGDGPKATSDELLGSFARRCIRGG